MNLPPLTPAEACRNRIASDRRNLDDLRDRYDSQLALRIPFVVLDCAARWVDAKGTGNDDLVRAAQYNLCVAVQIAKERGIVA